MVLPLCQALRRNPEPRLSAPGARIRDRLGVRDKGENVLFGDAGPCKLGKVNDKWIVLFSNTEVKKRLTWDLSSAGPNFSLERRDQY